MHDNIFELEYKKALAIPSDINQNLGVLHSVAKRCKHVTEMGVRTGMSTRAFLSLDIELISYDINLDKTVSSLFSQARAMGKPVKYIQANVLDIEIEETDFLFIDTLHVYQQLKAELVRHAKKVRKYIGFHDTYTFGLTGEDGLDKKGLLTAIIEFVIQNPEWQFKVFRVNNNGMTILQKRY
jgi:hypothetical protein